MKKRDVMRFLTEAGYDTSIARVITLEMHARLLNEVVKKAGGKFWFANDGILWTVLMCADLPSPDLLGCTRATNISFGQFYLSTNDAYDIGELADKILELDEKCSSLQASLPTRDAIQEVRHGTLVETCDGRYGIIRGVDWHALEFLKRPDYQVMFPDGTGIFRRDEFEIVNPRSVAEASTRPDHLSRKEGSDELHQE